MRTLRDLLLMLSFTSLTACAGDPESEQPGPLCAGEAVPEGPVAYFGHQLEIEVCGADPECSAPICWFCNGTGWVVAGNEACRPR